MFSIYYGSTKFTYISQEEISELLYIFEFFCTYIYDLLIINKFDWVDQFYES